MAKRGLVVVESPTKVKTIAKYLDGKYVVKASMGHVRDLPKSQLGVDPKKNFKPKYVVTPTKKKVLDDLKKAAEKADTLYVATDPDREGEAIGWHLAQELPIQKKNVYRITFNEITQRAVQRRVRRTRAASTSRRSTPSRRAACSTGSSATASRRCCGTRSSAGCRPDACSPWPCG